MSGLVLEFAWPISQQATAKSLEPPGHGAMKARLCADALRFGGMVLAGILAVGLAAVPGLAQDARATGGPSVVMEGRDATPVPLRVGPHRFLIPRNHFLHPPHRSGVDVAFGLRLLMPDMEPMTDANRHLFRMSSATEEGGRIVGVVFAVMPDRPRDDARWRLGNVLRFYGAALEDFAPPSDATHRLHVLKGPPLGNLNERRNDLFWGELPETRQFVAISCESASSFRVQYCNLWTDWQGRTVEITHVRRNLAQWRETAAAALALMDRLAIGSEGEGRNVCER